MSKVTWSAKMYLRTDDLKIKIDNLRVHSFQVSGGATRTVHLNSAEESDVAFELDDARDFKNLHIFISPTEGIAATQLGEAFIGKLEMDALFLLEARNGSTKLKVLSLNSEKVIIQRHPVTVQRREQRMLKIEMSLPEPSLWQTSYNPKGATTTQV